MKRLSVTCVAMTALLALQPISPAAAQSGNAKWFVLRDHTTSFCWVGLLISINGQYARSSAQLAGGPYNTEDEALARKSELEATGTCQSQS